MPNAEVSAQEKSRLRVNLAQLANFLLAAEFLWMPAIVGFVHAALFLNWPSFLPWLGLALALAPFPLRFARYGYLMRRTPFDLPLALFLISVIVGIVVSSDRSLGVGALQSFLVLTAAYYSIVNYPAPARVLKIGLPAGIMVLVIFLIRVPLHAYTPLFPAGLAIGSLIIAAMAFGIAAFRQRLILRLLSGLLGAALTAVVLTLANSQGSLERLFTLVSLKTRMAEYWLPTLDLMTGSSVWTGLGLGSWPLESGAIDQGASGLHVHNLYLELYVNLGVLGLLAFVAALAAGAKISADILYSDRKHPWYGFGVGVVLACIVALALGITQSAQFGIPGIVGGVYHYLFSPIPWILAVLLVTARRLLREPRPAP